MRQVKNLIVGVLLTFTALQAEELYATFTVEAKQSANLAFTSSGTVDKVLVDVSSVVKKGDLLAELQNHDLKAALNITETALKFAKKEYARQLKVKNLVDASSLTLMSLSMKMPKHSLFTSRRYSIKPYSKHLLTV